MNDEKKSCLFIQGNNSLETDCNHLRVYIVWVLFEYLRGQYGKCLQANRSDGTDQPDPTKGKVQLEK